MTDLRQRLEAMQASIVGNLDEQIDGGGLALLADVHGALAALDDGRAAQLLPADNAMARAIVRDVHGQPVAVVLYAEHGNSAAVELSPLRAISLAGELIEAASRRMR